LRTDEHGLGAMSENGAALPLTVYIGSGLIALLGLALPLVVLHVLDTIVPNAEMATLAIVMLGMAGVVLLDASLRVARAYMVGWIAARRHYALAVEAATRLLHAPPALVAGHTPGAHLDRMAALEAAGEYQGGASRLALLDLPFVGLAIVLLWLVAGWLVLVPVFLIVALGAFAGHRMAVLRRMVGAGHDGRRHDIVLDCLCGIATVKAMALESRMVARYERDLRAGSGMRRAALLTAHEAEAGAHLFAGLAMVATATAGAVQVIGGELSLGALAAAMLLASGMVEPLRNALGAWAGSRSIADARRRIRPLFELPPRTRSAVSPLVECRGAVSVRNLSFSYGVDQPLILKDLEIDIAPGEMVGLRGGDGSGKSTLMALMRGDLVPTNGDVRIDGYAACGPHRAALAGIVASVSESPALFQGTILDNIALFGAGEALEAAREAARLIGLDDAMRRLPKGYDTMIGDAPHDTVSQGLAQRILIARALARNPRVLLFDEANGALDAVCDRLLHAALASLKGRTTILLASQRPSLLRLADRVVALDQGRLREAIPDHVAPLTRRLVAS
jgi:ATP-binding cassette subfamily C protein LapB